MSEFLEMMAAPVVCALVLVGMHGYLGGHVVRRGVIFIDIALAQIAAFGVAVAMLLGAEVGTAQASLVGLVSSFLGAVLLSFTRTRNGDVPQEAYIGIVYVVFSAAMILVLSQVAHGGEEISNLLVGAILWVTWADVLKTAIVYGVLGLVLRAAHGPLMRISTDPDGARQAGQRIRLWDFLFYMVLGTVVTLSVQIAGVLMVFTLLVVPTVMSLRLFSRTRIQFVYVVIVGAVSILVGATASYLLDLPTGAAIVCVFGLLLTVQMAVESLRRA
ncbi:MAG: metal ABC transporter permease [bacterium]|nr:metal ABC transporter permease [bacterium]